MIYPSEGKEGQPKAPVRSRQLHCQQWISAWIFLEKGLLP